MMTGLALCHFILSQPCSFLAIRWLQVAHPYARQEECERAKLSISVSFIRKVKLFQKTFWPTSVGIVLAELGHKDPSNFKGV